MRRFAEPVRNAVVRYILEAQCVVCEIRISEFSPLCRWCLEFEKALPFITNLDHRSQYVLTERTKLFWHKVKYDKEYFFLRVIRRKLQEDLNLFFPIEGCTVVPVPLTFSKYLDRGFNQSQVLAQCWARKYGMQLVSNGLIKIRETESQSHLSKGERETNLKKAFEWMPGVPVPNTVLLIDDVYTTGSTLKECKTALYSVGVRHVYTWALFQTPF